MAADNVREREAGSKLHQSDSACFTSELQLIQTLTCDVAWMTRHWRNMTHSSYSDSGSVPLLLTNMQEPAAWLPWIPFQVFWPLLSAGAQHHALMASGSVCVFAEMCVCVCMCTDMGVCVSSILMLQRNYLPSATPRLLFITFFSLHPSHCSHSFLTLPLLISLNPHYYTSSPLLLPPPHRQTVWV